METLLKPYNLKSYLREAKISVIMPAYNEAHHIIANIRETMDTLKDFDVSYEIIVLDDGSRDNTFKVVKDFAGICNGKIKIYQNRKNFGKGRTLKKAFRYTKGEYIVFLDADLDLHPSQIKGLFRKMEKNNCDIVIGSKRHPKSVLVYPVGRRIISDVYFFLIKILFGLPVRDTQTGLKLFKRKVLENVLPRILVKKFAYDLEILAIAHHLGYKIAQIPVRLNFQRMKGRIRLKTIWDTFTDTLAIFYRLYIMRYYDHIDYYRSKNMAKEFRRMRK
jgi:glycosyltransferase involved in cell wall biosynthesis